VPGDDWSVFGALGVEDAERVPFERLAGLLAQLPDVSTQMFSDGLAESSTVLRVAEGVKHEVHISESKGRQKIPSDGDDLDIGVRVIGSKNLHTDLIELTLTSTLRLLVAEIRTRVPRLVRKGGSMLDERPAHARCLLRTERNMPAAAINEVVHLLGDDVGRLTDPREDADVLQDWGDDLLIPSRADHRHEGAIEGSPSGCVITQEVSHPRRGAEGRHAARIPVNPDRPRGPCGRRRTPS
jgi:hypothetical protein